MPDSNDKPLGFFSSFQKNVGSKKLTSRQDESNRIMLAFGQAVGQAKGVKANPNYAIEMVNGQHKVSSGIRDAYSASGTKLPRELTSILAQLDTLAESANNLSIMDPKIRRRLQGSTRAASLAVITQEHNKLLRQADELSREVLTEEARLNLSMLRDRASGSGSGFSRRGTSRGKTKYDEYVSATLDQLDMSELVQLRASGEFTQIPGITPGSFSSYFADRAKDEVLADEQIGATITSAFTEQQVDSFLAARNNPDYEPVFNDTGTEVLELPGFGGVEIGVVEQAQAALRNRGDGMRSATQPLTQADVQITSSLADGYLNQSASAVDAIIFGLSGLGLDPQILATDKMYKETVQDQQELSLKVEAAFQLETANEMQAALDTAYDDFHKKFTIRKERMIEAAPELIKPAIGDLLEHGRIASRENAEKMIAYVASIGNIEREVVTNPGLNNVAGLIRAVQISPEIQKASSSNRPFALGGETDALADIMAKLKSEDKDAHKDNSVVQILSNPVIREQARIVFSSEVAGAYFATDVARKLSTARQNILGETARNGDSPESLNALQTLDAVTKSLFGRVNADPKFAEFSPEAHSLYRDDPILIDSSDGGFINAKTPSGEDLTVSTIDPRAMVLILRNADIALEEAGINSDLLGTVVDKANADSLKLVNEQLQPNGPAQNALFSLMQDYGAYSMDPSQFIATSANTELALIRDAYRDFANDARRVQIASVASDDQIAAARERYVEEQVTRAEQKFEAQALRSGQGRLLVRFGATSTSANLALGNELVELDKVREEARIAAQNLSVNDLILGSYLGYNETFDLLAEELVKFNEEYAQ